MDIETNSDNIFIGKDFMNHRLIAQRANGYNLQETYNLS